MKCTRSKMPAEGRPKSLIARRWIESSRPARFRVTSMQVLLELQRDWARRETYDAVVALVLQHCGAYGQGVEYAYTMVHKQPPYPTRLKSGH